MHYLLWIAPFVLIGYYGFTHSALTYAIGAVAIYSAGLFIHLRLRKYEYTVISPIVLFPLIFVVIAGISIYRYLIMGDPGDVDFACYSSVAWNTLYGKFLYMPSYPANLLAVHSCYLFFVFIPFYAVGGEVGLLIAQALAFTGGLYLFFGSFRFSVPFLLILACALSPCIVSLPFYGFHIDVLLMPLLGWAVLSYCRGRFWQYFVALLLIPMVKESFGMVPVTFAAFAFVDKKPSRWYLAPFLSSVILTLTFILIISPALRTTSLHALHGFLPGSVNEVLSNFCSRPSILFAILLILTYLPSLFSGKLIYSAFSLGYILFYMILPDGSFRDFWRHYALVTGFLSIIPMVFANEDRIRKSIMPLLIISVISYPSWRHLFYPYTPSKQALESIRHALDNIPSDKSLVIHGTFVTHASKRETVINLIYRRPDWTTYDFALFDMSFKPEWWKGRDSLDFFAAMLIDSCGWETVSRQNGVVLLKNTGPLKK